MAIYNNIQRLPGTPAFMRPASLATCADSQVHHRVECLCGQVSHNDINGYHIRGHAIGKSIVYMHEWHALTVAFTHCVQYLLAYQGTKF